MRIEDYETAKQIRWNRYSIRFLAVMLILIIGMITAMIADTMRDTAKDGHADRIDARRR